MDLSVLVRRGAVAAVVALAGPVMTCAAAGATVTGSVVGASTSATGSGEQGASAPQAGVATASATPSPRPSVPSEAEVAEAQEAAEAAAREVADITARLEQAEARLEALQRAVADAVAADERAQKQLADAEAAVTQATEDLAAARQRRDHADRALSGSAALMYMQGGDLQNLTALALSPPDVMADLAMVLDQNAHRVRQNLDAATSAATDAAAKERQLSTARDDRAAAAQDAARKRTAAERQAAEASTEAARLATEQEALTARLAELEKGAEDLVARREAAARLSTTDLLGLQALGSPGTGPRAAQETARSMMASYGWDGAEFTCLVELWHGESGWSWSATNPSSGAYGIPQALPGWKMASAGSDWLTNPTTQITWGLDYIEDVYGSPCETLDRWLARSPHWY